MEVSSKNNILHAISWKFVISKKSLHGWIQKCHIYLYIVTSYIQAKESTFWATFFFSPFSSNILPFLFLFINFFSSNIHYFSSNIHYFFSNIPYFLKISIIPMNIHFSFEYPLFNQISTIFLNIASAAFAQICGLIDKPKGSRVK